MNLYPRALYLNLLNYLKDKCFLIITGARQTGKTSLLYMIRDHLTLQKEQVVYLTLEDPLLLNALNQHPANLLNFIHTSPDTRLVVLMDEIQYLKDPSGFLKYIYDLHAPKLKIIATGSSAFYIDKKFTDSLAGRKMLFELFTLDFDEYLMFQTGGESLTRELTQIRNSPAYRSNMRLDLQRHLEEYLTWGGYPAVVIEQDKAGKTNLLRELTGSFLKRDVDESNIRDHERFYQLLLLMAQQTGALVNRNELSRTLGISVTAVENYLYVLRKCYHLALVKPFARNLRKEIVQMHKLYFNDLGFRNVLMRQFSPVSLRPDLGMLLENYVYIRLRTLYGSDMIRFWRTADQHEVDFIITTTPDNGWSLEVKTDYRRFEPNKYRRFTDTYPQYPLHCRALNAPNNPTDILAL